MRITGGKYRGKNIEARVDRTLRPTTSFIRESIFNILQHGRFRNDPCFSSDDNPSLIENRRVVDIFCGTGALGIEALSRGASHVTFVDQNSKTLYLAEKNISVIGEKDNTTLVRSDSTKLPLSTIPCMLAFIDPPYKRNLITPALTSLVENRWLAEGAVIVIEHGKKDDIEIESSFLLLDTRKHDKTRLTILQFRGNQQ